MAFFKRIISDIAQKAGAAAGKVSSVSSHEATKEAIQGMDLFKQVARNKGNVAFDQAKGNLFEYIEAAKFNRNAASSSNTHRAVVTDSVGRPHDPADIEIVQANRVVRQVQAKFSDSKHAAADSVTMQRKDKYAGMQRLIRKEDRYVDESTGETTTLLKKAQQLATQRASKEGAIYQDQYRDVAENLTDELNHDGISSGGTTLDEVHAAYDDPGKYALRFERKQIVAEMKHTAGHMAAASMVTTGITSGVTNIFAVLKNEKDLAEALSSVGVDVVESGTKSAATGVVGVAIQTAGLKAGSNLLSDAMASTVLAGGIIDGGVALYSYAKGEINAEQLRDEIVDTTVKASATVFYTKAIAAILGKTVTPFVPMAVYTTASYVVACTREIIRNAILNEQEYHRMTVLLEESTRSMKAARVEFENYLSRCEEQQKKMLDTFIDSFSYNIETGENYDQAISSIVSFANQAGIVLQHVRFDDFVDAMRNNMPLQLG